MRLRFDPAARGGRALAHYVGASVLTSLAVTALTRFAADVTASGSLGSASRMVGYSASGGIGWKSSFLIGLITGALLWCGHRYVLPDLAAGTPAGSPASSAPDAPAWALALADATVRSGQTPQPWLAQMADGAAHLQVRRIRLGRGRVLMLGGVLAAVVVLGVVAALGQALAGHVGVWAAGHRPAVRRRRSQRQRHRRVGHPGEPAARRHRRGRRVEVRDL